MKIIIIGAGTTAYSEYANPDRRPPLSNTDLLSQDIIGNTNLDLLNMRTLLQGKLFMEMQLCIGTKGRVPILPYEMPICAWHRKLVKHLNSEDTVVSFNYDLIAPYALLNEKKLSRRSFHNQYIKEVDIPEKLISHNPVTLITPHGSFSWLKLKRLNYYDKNGVFHHTKQFFSVWNSVTNDDLSRMSPAELADFNFKLDPTHLRVNLNNNFPIDYYFADVILPSQNRKQALESMPHFKEEYDLFLNKLKQADEVYLVGKNFKTSDKDIADDIKEICSRLEKKHIVYINPDSKDIEWIDYHNKIFNAGSHEVYNDLPNYINVKGL